MDLIARDLSHVWHPCSQMKDYETFPPLIVEKAQGSFIYCQGGQRLIDVNSSWWCKSLGHGHPHIQQAVKNQMDKFEHVIMANTTHDTLVNLAEKLSTFLSGLDKIMFASDGSCAVEIALKMALHAKSLQGESHRQSFMALENGYHGETCLTLSVSDLGIYRKAYEPLLHKVEFLNPLPYVSSKEDPLWDDCSSYWPAIEAQLNQHKETLCAIIFEPILQGAGGMLIYSQDFLRRLRSWSKANGVYLIADEILTGFGRTGLPLACQHSDITPDFLCLSKGLTGGFLPLSAMLTSTPIYNLFYDDYEKGKSFLHSHTHSGNALALAAALATLEVFEQENIFERLPLLAEKLTDEMTKVADNTGLLHNIRHVGAMVAADLIIPPEAPHQRLGFAVYQEAVKLGALLRPIGNSLYWLPPLNIEFDTVEELGAITTQALMSANHKMAAKHPLQQAVLE